MIINMLPSKYTGVPETAENSIVFDPAPMSTEATEVLMGQ